MRAGRRRSRPSSAPASSPSWLPPSRCVLMLRAGACVRACVRAVRMVAPGFSSFQICSFVHDLAIHPSTHLCPWAGHGRGPGLRRQRRRAWRRREEGRAASPHARLAGAPTVVNACPRVIAQLAPAKGASKRRQQAASASHSCTVIQLCAPATCALLWQAPQCFPAVSGTCIPSPSPL